MSHYEPLLVNFLARLQNGRKNRYDFGRVHTCQKKTTLQWAIFAKRILIISYGDGPSTKRKKDRLPDRESNPGLPRLKSINDFDKRKS